MLSEFAIADAAVEHVPLVVDLDGTLIQSDLLVETAFAYFGRNPLRIGSLLLSLFRGKAALKAKIAEEIEIDPAHLPYDNRVLDLIRKEREKGRPVYLASASNERYVSAVAAYLGLFDGWFASDATMNLSSSSKAARLVEAFGKGGFDYAGNATADFAVWKNSRKRICVSPSPSVGKSLLALDGAAIILPRPKVSFRDWVKLLRVHQWAKNALVVVPLITAHSFNLHSLAVALAAFFAFSLAASAVYLVNDLVDLDADRKHRTKKNRPLAAGKISVLKATTFAPLLVAFAMAGAFLLSSAFAAVLGIYLALTTAYTFVLKRKAMLDVITLAMLYTIRVVGGAVVIGVPASEWLLAFSLFIFTALALVKRYTELAGRLDANLPDPANRDYKKSDLDIVAAMAAAAGFNAVTVFSLYISSEAVRRLYTHPFILWLICPILMYWLGRVLILAHRRRLDDDPVVFAIKDRNSLLTGALIGTLLLVAS